MMLLRISVFAEILIHHMGFHLNARFKTRDDAAPLSLITPLLALLNSPFIEQGAVFLWLD